MRILVCDDDEVQYKPAKRLIPDEHEVDGLCGTALTSALRTLFQAASDSIDASQIKWGDTSRAFEGYDLTIIDNDLSVLELNGVPLSAEGLVGYLRTFTDTPYIVSLNKNQDVDFDLRNLYGDDRSQADLALNTDHLACRRLWGLGDWEGFAPWYWPHLPSAAERRRQQIEFVADHLHSSIWQELGFPDLAGEYLSRRAKGPLFISGTDQTMQETTFRQFFDNTRMLLPRQRQILAQSATQGDSDALRAVCRLVAADLDRWIRRDVLGPQDVLIDVPHLLARRPCLLGDAAGDLDCWNHALRETEQPYGLDADLYKRHLGDARFRPDMWAPSPCFWWPPLRQNAELTELDLAPGDWPDAVFCEDISIFERMDYEADQPREVEVETEGSWPRRHIVEVEGRNYSPRSRLV